MQDVSKIGVAAVSLIFEKIGFVFREQPVGDYGIDAIVEERLSRRELSGKLIGVQIKSGAHFFEETKDDKVVFRGEMKHYEYWRNYSLPVILVLYHPETQLCIYEVISDDKITMTEKAWKIEIDTTQRLENGAAALRNLSKQQSEYHKRLSVLAFSKTLMQLAKEKKLAVEVGEWINKSSGRGEFLIMTVDKNGRSKKLYEKTIWGFGVRPYEEVLPEVFPWADLVIDEDYYKIHGDPKYIEFRKKQNPFFYPYCNAACEVDWYRFRPVLNEIGEAFLTMDRFLNEGHMYKIKF